MKAKFAIFLVIAAILILATSVSAVFPDTWVQSNTSGFGDAENETVSALEVFDDALWAGTENEYGAQLFKLDEGIWTPMITDGFTNTNNLQVSDLISFKSMLYAGTLNNSDGGQILRSLDGIDWEVVTPDLDPHHQDIFTFATFQGKIYAGTASYSNNYGAEIWRSTNGSVDSWTRVVEDGFYGGGTNQKVVSIQEYNGLLYASVDNVTAGAEVWSSEDGESWTLVSSNGFGDSDNWSVTLQAFGGYLYAGTYNYTFSPDPGLELWRCEVCIGSDWEQVPILKGFGDTENRAIRSFEIYNRVLYALTYNNATGMEVWTSSDGVNWEQANLDGFGDSENIQPHWDNSAESYKGRFYVGTYNDVDGGEVWSYYEANLYLPVVLK